MQETADFPEAKACMELKLDHELIHDIQGRMILHWNYRNLREIPVEVINYGEHIEEIYLKRNCLEKLPASIGKLSNLTNLYLVGNQLEELPPELGDLKNLRVLDVSQNYIKKLPETIGDLNNMESLLLTYNQLEELPKCIKKLRRLKQLEVSGNRIHTLSLEIIKGLESLEELGIDRNPLSTIPRNISMLRNLRYFSACRCNLLFLPNLPFHTLLHHRISSKQFSTGTSICNGNLQFLFDGNPRLNYVPYWVFQLLGTNIECFGCGLDPGESDNAGVGANPQLHALTTQQTQLQLYTYRHDVNRPRIKLNFKGKRRTLHFDEDLVKLHHCGFDEDTVGGGKVALVSLLELCLRQVYNDGLLETTLMKKCGAKPVVEPLIVPQRAGTSLINIRGDLEGRKIVDENAQSSASTSEQSTCEFLESSEAEETTMKSDNKDDGASNSHHYLRSGDQKINNHQDHNPTMAECRSTTPKENNQTQTNSDNITLPDENSSGLILPTNLTRILDAGPVVKCFECMKPIFTETWPIVFHILEPVPNDGEPLRQDGNENEPILQDRNDHQEDGKLSIGCVHFCSANCTSRFRTGKRFSSNLHLNDLRCIVDNELSWVLC